MKKSTTASYILELEVVFTPSQRREVEARREVARVIYNTCLGRVMKRWRGVQGSPKWRSALRRVQEINAIGDPSPDEMKERTALRKEMREVEKDFGLTEYELHAFVKEVNVHFDRRISINEAQVTATRAFRTFEKHRYGQCKKVRFLPKGAEVTVENKSNNFGLRVVGQELVWKDLRAPLVVKKGDRYAEDAFLDRTKYVRLLSRTIRGRRRYFVQIVKEGKPPRKNRTVGSADSAVGIDIGPSAVAYYSTGEKKAAIEPLAPNACCEELDRKVGRLQRCMARSLEANNPDAKDENGRWKKSVKLNKSKRWEKNRVKLANLKRRLAVNRRQDHEKAANRIIALGTDVRVEDTPITSWTKRAKETTVRKKDGKINRKKRFGKSVANHAPGLLLNCIARKLGNVGKELKRVKSSKVKASQRNHVDGSCRKKELSERWFEVDGRRVQRDLYSSWLIAHVMENGEEIDLNACQDDWPNFLRAQAEALAKTPKNLGIL